MSRHQMAPEPPNPRHLPAPATSQSPSGANLFRDHRQPLSKLQTSSPSPGAGKAGRAGRVWTPLLIPLPHCNAGGPEQPPAHLSQCPQRKILSRRSLGMEAGKQGEPVCGRPRRNPANQQSEKDSCI